MKCAMTLLIFFLLPIQLTLDRKSNWKGSESPLIPANNDWMSLLYFFFFLSNFETLFCVFRDLLYTCLYVSLTLTPHLDYHRNSCALASRSQVSPGQYTERILVLLHDIEYYFRVYVYVDSILFITKKYQKVLLFDFSFWILFAIHFWKFEKLSFASNSSEFLQKFHRQNRKTQKWKEAK